MDDKRGATRLSKFIPVMIEDSKVHMLFRANIGDISYEGMRVVAGQFLPKGTRYTFNVKAAQPIIVKGEVRWISATGPDSFRIGIHFVDMTPDIAAAIQTLVDREARTRTPQRRAI